MGADRLLIGVKQLGANRLEGIQEVNSRYTTHPKNKHSSSALGHMASVVVQNHSEQYPVQYLENTGLAMKQSDRLISVIGH